MIRENHKDCEIKLLKVKEEEKTSIILVEMVEEI